MGGMAYTIDLRSVQAPLKDRYRSDPTSAVVVTAAHSAPSDLAICEESTLRSVAANMGVELEPVHVGVRIHWDFRGTMGVDRDVPIGATGIEMRTQVKVKEGVDAERAKRLLSSAERYCSTLQTLRHGVEED